MVKITARIIKYFNASTRFKSVWRPQDVDIAMHLLSASEHFNILPSLHVRAGKGDFFLPRDNASVGEGYSINMHMFSAAERELERAYVVL
jgi:hypothetical protein